MSFMWWETIEKRPFNVSLLTPFIFLLSPFQKQKLKIDESPNLNLNLSLWGWELQLYNGILDSYGMVFGKAWWKWLLLLEGPMTSVFSLLVGAHHFCGHICSNRCPELDKAYHWDPWETLTWTLSLPQLWWLSATSWVWAFIIDVVTSARSMATGSPHLKIPGLNSAW